MLKGLSPMTKTLKLIANQGATFVNAFTSSPICCPSRSSLLSGQYAHNNKAFNNSKSGGCFGTHWRETVEPEAFPVLLQKHGYKTFFAGKYLNEYYSKEVPVGWNEWYGLHGNSRYFNYTLNENGKVLFHFDEYLTDLLKNRTLRFLQDIQADTPFFAMIAPPAPHEPFTAAHRHENMFPHENAVRTKNFNVPFGPLEKHWLLTMPPSPLPEQIVKEIDIIYRKRWQSLMAVDEMVDAIVTLLEERELMTNTYFIFTSDNGYHMGQFSQPYDKRQPYETDIRVPFLIRGPKVAPKSLVSSPIALIDVAPTVLELAGIPVPSKMDGASFISKLNTMEIHERQILIEYWGEGNYETYNPECPWQRQDKLSLCSSNIACHCQDSWNNTFSCVRHLGREVDMIYCQFKDNENFVEAYDLTTDSYQINNIAYEMLPSIRAHYSLVLTNLTKCSGETCRQIYY
ncbi:N-acetylglucosamine-6-sulfatase-like [Sabethes cyaneus]|uniref:N-acetylglucosamine-6-sulfatase-like n=1 Tax=Sabethes cyaneus TaxID=53552 RepID=UPI00237E8697|nr:N-acetylglucosamine-6-sulfatase-like [Sabethes cyaneus]